MTGGFGPSLGPVSPVDPSRWSGTARVLGPRWFHLPVLTIGLLGVQIFWSVEMSYASPYLLSLGLTTSHVALVFLAGPLSGLVVQPLVGAFADTSTSRWGRRRPFILAGCVLCVGGMLLLGYTRSVAALFLANGSHAHGVLTVILAVLAIFVIDFSINAVQAVDRALLVDTLPTAQQAAGNACAALMLGFGSVVGFFIGNLPLQTLLPFLQAESELQALSVLVSVLLLACHGLTAALVRERVLLKTKGAPRPSLRHEIREIWTHARRLPRVIRQICIIQFFAWLGWFPVLFYTTMYITDVYLQDGSKFSPIAEQLLSTANSTASSNDATAGVGYGNGTTDYPPLVRLLSRAFVPALHAARAVSSPLNATTSLPGNAADARPTAVADADAPTRLGARAQLLSALLALAANALLPLVIPDPAASSESDGTGGRRRGRGMRNSRLLGRVDIESVGLSPVDGTNGLANGANGLTLGGGGKEQKDRWWRVPDAARVPLPTLWVASHAIFAGCMVGSFFTHSVAGATFLIACTGFSWGVTQWAPFSLLAEAILTSPALSDADSHARNTGSISTSIRLADTRTRRDGERPEEEEGFLVSRPGEESDSEGEGDGEDSGEEIEFVRPAGDRERDGLRDREDHGDALDDRENEEEEDDTAYPPRKPHHAKNASILLGNPAAQLSVVDVLTPRSNWGDDGRFEPGVGVGLPQSEGEGLMSPSTPGDLERALGGGEGREVGGLSAKAGVILGIHNIFIVIPQFLVTGLSAMIFAIFDGRAAPPGHAPQPGETETGRNSVVYVFRIGGIWASIAFVLAWRLARELRRR